MPDEDRRPPQQNTNSAHGVQRAAVSGLETLGAAWPAAGWSRHAADALFSSLATSNLMDAADFAQSNSHGEALMGLSSVGSLLQQPNPLQQLQALQAHHLAQLTKQVKDSEGPASQSLGAFSSPDGPALQQLLQQHQHQQQKHNQHQQSVAQAAAATSQAQPQVVQMPRPRWKPNQVQISLLEQHFGSGNSKPTTELTANVQAAGEATEQQVGVWLKNRLARAKRDAKIMETHSAPREDASESSRKRSRGAAGAESEPEVSGDDVAATFEGFQGVAFGLLRDLHMVMEGIDPTEQEQVCSSIRSSSKLAVFGHGMEGTVLKTFARQLCDIGIQAASLDDVACPSLDQLDLLLVSAGTMVPSVISAASSEARRAGVKVICFTALQRSASLSFADAVTHLPLTRGSSGELLGCSYELALQLLLETATSNLRRILEPQQEAQD